MLKRAFLLFLCLSAIISTNAQEPLYFSENPNAMLYSLPRTLLKIKVITTRETVSVGKYAAYAQKFLGEIAPLSDKNIYSIASLELTSIEESDPMQVFAINASDKTLSSLVKQTGALPMPISGTSFKPDLGDKEISFIEGKNVSNITNPKALDKFSSDFKSDEENAEELANIIFSLRKRRIELISGDVGENVFGAGLKAALDEIRVLESEYLSLFYGKNTVNNYITEFYVIPESGNFNYVFSRFSPDKGLVSLTDLSADPLILKLDPDKINPIINKSRAVLPVSSKDAPVIDLFKYRIAVPTQSEIYLNSKPLLSNRVQIYQFGAVVDVPLVVDIKK